MQYMFERATTMTQFSIYNLAPHTTEEKTCDEPCPGKYIRSFVNKLMDRFTIVSLIYAMH